ncbi:prepilin peptidase [Candidatus Peregrinibacteria bacterium]|jgi:prepilin signal peptidase PulO-like enzyme (type II secretory pathway)|nr:prepilin peptidase [Candidatus Peregrinibacteria bacterium]
MEASIPFLIFIFGTCIGSFLSVLIHRIHENEKGILLGRSKCPECKYSLRPLDLIPLISYVFSRGKCRNCEKKISLTYPALELMTGATFLCLYLFLGSPLYIGIYYILAFAALIFTFFYDIKYMKISDRILLPVIGLGLLMPFVPGYSLGFTEVLIGFAIPVVFFALQILISGGRWIGGGDLRIGALMGVLLGWKLVIVALFSGYLAGAIISLILLTSSKFNRKSMIPFGPFLVIGTYIAFFYGERIIEWYLALISV